MTRVITLAFATALAATGSLAPVYAQEGAPALSPEDYMEIQQLYARYVRAADMGGGGDGSAWAECFTPDGEFGNSKGHEALKKIITNFHRNTLRRDGWSSRHTYSSLLVTPTGEGTAKGSVYALVFNVTARPPFVDHSGVYEDWLVKTPDGWRFKKRIFKPSGTFQPAMP
ncbi:MAG: nuclear transport factor 2 family protein [Acidimicrobiia bacterium]|nr:nuclear transport factor 2 family protein [Acidimicrobiia bacterium]